MARQLGDTSADLVNDAPTVADKGAELELKAANFEEQYGITADTPEEKAALEVAKNNILNNIDSQAVYNDYMSGKYAEIDLTSPTPTTVNEDGVNEPIVDEEPFTYPVVPDFKPDYSLNPEDPTKIGIDPETGTGLTGTAFTGVSDLVDPNWTPDYSLYNPTSGSTDGQGLKLPTTSNLEDMGGGQGLTSGEVGAGESTDGLTVDLSGKDAVTPEDLTDPSLVGVDDSNYKLDPLEVETQTPGNIVAVGTPKKPATDSNLPRGSDIAPKPANASATNPDGTEAVPTWKSALLTPGLLTSTYNPNADYSFKGTYTPQAIDISQQTPLQQINPVFQQQQPQTDTTTMPQTQNTSGYYNYGVEKSPLSFDSSPFYGSSTPQVAHLRGGGLAMASPLMAAGGVPYKGSHYVQGAGGGQDDLIDARLADGEYVFDADVVAALGDGSNTEGARKLDAMRESIRKQKRSAPINRIPPKAKSPLAYLKGVK